MKPHYNACKQDWHRPAQRTDIYFHKSIDKALPKYTLGVKILYLTGWSELPSDPGKNMRATGDIHPAFEHSLYLCLFITSSGGV